MFPTPSSSPTEQRDLSSSFQQTFKWPRCAARCRADPDALVRGVGSASLVSSRGGSSFVSSRRAFTIYQLVRSDFSRERERNITSHHDIHVFVPKYMGRYRKIYSHTFSFP